MVSLMCMLIPTIVGFIVVSCANINAAGLAIKESPSERHRLTNSQEPQLNVEARAFKLFSIVSLIFKHTLLL